MKNLTDKQNGFCEEYVANGYNGAGAYRKAYNTEDSNAAAVEACKMLRLPKIIERIKEVEGDYRILGFKLGIDRKRILEEVKGMLAAKKKTFNKEGGVVDESPDFTAINNAIITWAKLTGEFEAEKKSIVIGEESGLGKNPAEMTPEEMEVKKAEILKEMEA